jgi:hypothetical protein
VQSPFNILPKNSGRVFSAHGTENVYLSSIPTSAIFPRITRINPRYSKTTPWSGDSWVLPASQKDKLKPEQVWFYSLKKPNLRFPGFALCSLDPEFSVGDFLPGTPGGPTDAAS